MSGFGGFGGFGQSSSNNNNTSSGFGFGSSNNNNTASGFGSNTNTGGFGSNTGGGLFGGAGTSGGFGSNTGGFGSNTTGAFGQQKPAFGSTTTTSGGGLFGSSTTTAGGTGFGGFGSNTNNTTSNAFGGGSSMFGGSTANKPAFGSTGTTGTSGGLFGGGNTTSGFGTTSAFNAPSSTALGGPVGDPPGTGGTTFSPLVEKESATSSAQNSFQSILFQEPYKKWSAEELRLADYAQGRRFGSGTAGFGTGFGGGFGTNTQSSSGFGTTNTGTSSGLFGGNTTNNTGGFGSNATSGGGFGSGGLFGGNKPATTTGGLFGGASTTQPAAQSGGLFGNTGGSAFGNNTANTNTNTSGVFGSSNTNTGGGLFGNNTQNKPAFGSGFGSTTNTTGGFGSNTGTTSGFGSNTGGGLFGGSSTQNSTGQTGGGLFGNTQQQNNTSSAFGGTGFGSNTNTSGGLFGNNQPQKPATGGGLFGNTGTTTTGGGLFGQSNNQTSGFGQSTQNQSGGLFGSKPATTGGGLFGNAGQTPNTNTGGGLFGNAGQNNQQQNQTGGGLFGSTTQNQQKPSLFGSGFGTSTQSTGGGLFGNQSNQQQGSIFGTSNAQQQPQNSNAGSSLFGSTVNNQTPSQSFTASVNDPSAYGTSSLFGNLQPQTNDPGPLATPLSGRNKTKRPSILPIYKLNPASASRFVTPQKRGYGFSYSTYGTPSSPSSVSSTPGLSNSLLGGSLPRGLPKSISSSNLRRSFNVEDSLLAPGAFSASTSSRIYGGNSVKRLVINREMRNDLFSTPTKDKSSQGTPNGSGRPSKRVSFDTNNVPAIENGDIQNDAANVTPSAEELGYIRPSPRTNGVTNSRPGTASSNSGEEQIKGNELAVVHEEETTTPAKSNPSAQASDRQLGEYWMRPTKEEIQNMNRVQRQKVVDFTVGRENSGWVKFKVPVDLTTIDLDDLFDNIVLFEVRQCTVYPNPAKKPPVGKGLNVPSLINLENSWPRRSRGKAGSSLAKHLERLKRIPGTHFEKYNEETGEWTFSVDHFTTYGLDYDDEDDTEANTRVEPAESGSASPVSSRHSDEDDIFDFRRKRRALPGAFDAEELDAEVGYDDQHRVEMTEVRTSGPSFLADRSVGSTSKALVPVEQDNVDDEYAMSEDQEVTSTSPRQHLAAEPEDDSLSASPEFTQETPAGVMRARMRAIKESATPMKVQVAAGDDWMDMLQKTISPQKRDRALLKSQHEASYKDMDDNLLDRPSPRKRIVSDGRGFATSIDLMKSIFDQAKVPSDKPQTSVRQKIAKFPYKRSTKTLDEGEMDSKDREWHDTLRPTWGFNGTLVYLMGGPMDAYGRSIRSIERNGLMTVMKGSIVSESQDIRFARFSNEGSAKALRAHIDLTEVYLDNGIPTVMGPRVSLKEFSSDAGNKNPASEHEKLVWELASVLFDSIKIPAELQNDPDADDTIRRENLSRFWEQIVEIETNKAIAMARGSEEKALAALAGHRIADACKNLLDGKDFRLATLIALIGSSDDVKKDMREQLQEWQEANVLSEFSDPIRALYEMLSGNVCVCEGKKGGSLEHRMESFVISERFGLQWRQAFGLRLWYATAAQHAIADAVEKFKDDIDQNREALPITWFAKSGVKTIWNDKDKDQREDLLWGLLKLYADHGADLENILRPENSQLSPLDYRLSWQLGRALTATGKVSFGKNAEEKADAATLNFASQLTNEGSWQEAAFVLLHLNDPDARAMAIQEHLCRHAGLIGNDQSDSYRRLTEKFKIPAQWIWHAKALYMRSVKKDAAAEVQCLLRAESFAEAHRTFVKDVAPLAIIERDYDALADLLRQFDGRQSQVPDWRLGGEVYKAFLQLMGHVRRQEQPPSALVNSLLEGLPAMHGNAPEAGIREYAALTDMAADVARVVGEMARSGQMEYQRILKLPLTEDVRLRHSRDLAWSHYRAVMAGGQ